MADEDTTDFADTWKYYNQPPWNFYRESKGGEAPSKGQMARYSSALLMDQIFPGSGMLVKFPWGAAGRNIGGFLGFGKDQYAKGMKAGDKQLWADLFEQYGGGQQGDAGGGWGDGYGVWRGDKTQPVTPGMQAFLGQGMYGNSTSPFGYNVSGRGWEDAMIAGRGGIGKERRSGGSGGLEGIKHLR